MRDVLGLVCFLLDCLDSIWHPKTGWNMQIPPNGKEGNERRIRTRKKAGNGLILNCSTLPCSFRHNDLPWNIRKFVHNKLDSVNFTHNLKYVEPWAKSKWSHTDISRLMEGQVGCQVRKRDACVEETEEEEKKWGRGRVHQREVDPLLG